MVATSVNELDIVWKYRETCIFCETVLHYLKSISIEMTKISQK